MNPKVTVLMTVFNGLSYLKESIDSVLEQTFRDFEFLIVDDASTDKSLEFIESYADPRIRIVRNEKNIGQVASLNKGLQHASGEFIARLDQDDVNLPTRLEAQFSFMNSRSDVAIVCSYEHTIDSDGKYVCSWTRKIPNYGDFLGYIVLGLCPVWHPSVMFRKDVVQRLGGYDTSFPLAEDYALWSSIALSRFNGAVVPQFHLLQRVHSQRQSHLQGARQKDSADRAHERAIAALLPGQQVGCLAALLRLERDPCGRAYDRTHASALARQLQAMLQVIRTDKRLTDAEFRSLSKKVYRRLGLGVRYAAVLAYLPSPIFMPIFYALSPLLLANLRAWLSGLNYRRRKLLGLLRH
jgi:cellulose synthase/poly-beta-1,6-N-acetylglucosamine synthase-like glycosyltransferase